MRAWPKVWKGHVGHPSSNPVIRRSGCIRLASSQSMATIRSRQGIFDDAEVSRAIYQQRGTFNIGLLLGAQSSRRAHQMRAKLIDGYKSDVSLPIRIPILRPLPAAQICLGLPPTMEALCAGKEKIFQLHPRTPCLSGSAVLLEFIPNNQLRRLQNKLLAAFGTIDDMGDPTAYLLAPAFGLVNFGLKKSALIGCLDLATREFETGIQPFTAIGLCFRYSPAIRGTSKWDPYNISRSWVDYHFGRSSTVRSHNAAERASFSDSALGFRRLRLDQEQSESSEQARAQVEPMITKQMASRRWVFNGDLY
ncbi:hypothetical protein QTJ16_006568 [Diplocarpon rosae]|uniref:Uncharacterized protein n=1 Tax=Diplocarpon rosae TaxID=946125 RepID=A0AAD9SVX7_9HELO|nr:hypothetical protein QTJ16_006568 [Diplocarpon rosae]